jgi:hypothetical protein
MEHGGSINNKEHTDATTTTKGKLEHDATAKDLEEETKRAMETVGLAFLKEKMEISTSSGIPDPTGDRDASNRSAATIASSSDSSTRILPSPLTMLPQVILSDIRQLGGSTLVDQPMCFISSDRWSATVVHAPDLEQGCERLWLLQSLR